jgi:glycerate-2-kinase
LSLARGGFLAKYVYPAKVIALIFSDVPSNKLEFIASGPTIKDTTTVDDAKNILKKYKVESQIGFNIDFLIETPKQDKYFKNVENILFLSNKEALKAMADYARSLKYRAKIKTDQLKGEAQQIGRQIAFDIKKEKNKTVLIYGGETTVKIIGKGKGGRNQELALSALRFIDNNELVIAFASDGKDNSLVAGAIADIFTKKKAKKLNLDIEKYLANNDSYSFFQKTGDFVKTGDTGSNVSDLIIALKI